MVLVFARDVDDGLVSLIGRVDALVKEIGEPKLRAFVVVLGDKSDELSAKLSEVATEKNLTIPLTIAKDGSKGPKKYHLDPAVKTTVLLYSQGAKVVEAFAFDAVEEADVEKVAKAARKAAG